VASYEQIFGKATARSIKRNAGIPAKKKPAPKPAPKAPAPKRKVAAPRGPSSGPKFGPTPQRAAAEGKAQRVYLNSPAGKQATFLAQQNAELAGVEAQYLKGHRPAKRPVNTAAAGINADPAAYTRLANIGGGGSNFLKREIGRASNEALNILTSGPATVQLLAENTAAVPIAPLAYASRVGVPGLGFAERYQNRVLNMDKTAIKSQIDFNKYLYGGLADAGQDPAFGLAPWSSKESKAGIRQVGERALEYPLTTALNIAGVKSIIGRSPAYVARATRFAVPTTEMAAKASRSLSTLPEADRVAQNLQANIQRGTVRPLPQGSRKPIPFAPGKGGRVRPPREYVSRASDNPNDPVGVSRLSVDQAPYSGDAFARRRQEAVDRFRATHGKKLEARANARAAEGKGTTISRPFGGITTEAKYRKAQVKQTRLMVDRAEASAGALRDRVSKPVAISLAKLKKDTNVAGVRDKKFLHTEEAAVRLHWDDSLSERGGLTPVQLRDKWVATKEEQFAANDWGSAEGKRRAREQIDAVKAIPEPLLTLTDMSNPAVRRVSRAVEAGRVADAANQAQSVKAGVVTEATAVAAKSRPSAIDLGGSRWWKGEVGKVKQEFNPKLRKVQAKIEAERIAARDAAASGDLETARVHYANARKLEPQARSLRGQRDHAVHTIKEGATRETPQLTAQRAKTAEANNKLSREVVAGKASKVPAATRARDREFKRLRKMENDALGMTKPTRPELVGDKGVYLPDRSVVPEAKRTGPRSARIGTDEARQNKGVIRTSAELDLRPNLMMDQVRRSADNYAGRRSPKATAELIDTIAYKTPDGNLLRLDSKAGRQLVDNERVAYINTKKLERAQKALDELPEGEYLHPKTVKEVFTDNLDSIPEKQRGDYIAVHKDAKDVWTEMMGPSDTAFFRYWDKGLTYWKGALLALSPRWYLNNTVGLALQYGVLAPGDVVSILRGNDKRVRQSMENRAAHVARDTLANEAQGSSRVIKPIRKGFEINSRMEEVWRRAAYANRAKRLLQNEGVKVRKLSNEDFARALENMPDSAIRQIVRDVDYFIGDYRKFTPIERNIIKRVVPFYSWLRVISKLTFGLPFRSPLRALAIATLGRAAEAGLDPYAPLRPWYSRPALNFGDIQVGVTSASPQMTVAGFITALTAPSPGRAILAEATSFLHPILGLIETWPQGLDTFGNRVAAAPGQANFGQDPKYLSAATGKVEAQSAGIATAQAFLNLVAPGQISLVTKIMAGDRTPRATTQTPQIVADFFSRQQGAKRNEALYYPKSKSDPPAVKFPFSPALSAIFGVNVVRTNPAALARQAKQQLDKYVADQRKLERAKRKASR
jgi:hypothetical protein